MFKFTNLGVAGAGANADAEIVAENYSIENDGHLLAVQEAYEDLSDVMEAMADTNAAAVDAYVEGRNNGTPEAAMESFNATVMEGFLGNMKDKLVNILKKMWAKVKAFFKSALQYFNALWMSGKKFAEKYEDEIKDAAGELDGKLKIKMYKYDDSKLPDVKNVYSVTCDIFAAELDDIVVGSDDKARKSSEAKKKAIEKVAAKFGGSGAKTADQMLKNIRKAVHSGKENPESVTITSSDVDEMLKVLTSDDLIDDCENAAKDADDNFKEKIDGLEQMRDDIKDDKNNSKDDVAIAKVSVSSFIAAKDVAMKIFSVYKSLVSEREAAYKSALSKVLHYSPKKKDDED